MTPGLKRIIIEQAAEIKRLEAENRYLNREWRATQAMRDKVLEENERLREALEVAGNQLEGVALAVLKHGTNINPSFFVEYYTECAEIAREALGVKSDE